MKYVILDLDGTCADCSHRLVHIVDENGDKLEKQNWKQFFENCYDDDVFEDMKKLAFGFIMAEMRVVFVTGRPEAMRNETNDWISDKFINVVYDLHMRENGDFRPDYEVKTDLVHDVIKDRYHTLPMLAFEDRDSVIEYWYDEFDFPVIDVKQMRCQTV